MEPKVAIGSDTKRAEVRHNIVDYLASSGIKYNDLGHTDNYADIAEQVAKQVAEGQYSLGILICRNGIGMSIVANKVHGIRAARCISEQDAYDGRYVNDANVLALGDVDRALAERIIEKWITTEFNGSEKYMTSLEKIAEIETKGL